MTELPQVTHSAPAGREYALAPDPVPVGRRKRRAIRERVDGGPWVVIRTVAASDADGILETVRQAYRNGCKDETNRKLEVAAREAVDALEA